MVKTNGPLYKHLQLGIGSLKCIEFKLVLVLLSKDMIPVASEFKKLTDQGHSLYDATKFGLKVSFLGDSFTRFKNITIRWSVETRVRCIYNINMLPCLDLPVSDYKTVRVNIFVTK